MNPADRAWPGDPEISNVSMLEVCDQARREAMAAREHAVKMMMPFALRALLDGHDPRQIARACGFGTPEAEEPEEEERDDDFLTLRAFWGETPRRRPDAVEAFARWLADGVRNMVKDRA